MIFETKKIQLETLSEYLTEARAELKMSLEEVAEKTKIQTKFLEYLEHNQFHKLPADVYVFGFLRELASFYSVDPKSLVEQYKKERVIGRQLQKKAMFETSEIKKVLGKIIITPKYLSLSLGLLFVVITLGYIIWQVSSINKQPSLEITTPQDRQIISDSVAVVSGRTDAGMQVTINEQNVFVDSQGNFKTQLSINNGPQPLVFVARNKFNKSTSKTIMVIGENSTQQASSTTPTAGVQLRLEFTDNVVLSFTIDDGPLQSATFTAGEVKVLSGQRKIVISTSNAGATRVAYNDESMGLLGKPGEKLSNVAFSAKSDTIPTAAP